MAGEQSPYGISLLGKHHARAAFSCGRGPLDDYLHRQAGQEGRRRVAVTYVLTQADDPGTICGYYTLSAYTLELRELPEEFARRLPRYPLVGATLLGRLAVDERFQGRKLGKVLLWDALRRSFEQSKRVASVAVVVDALDEAAGRFYEHHGFIRIAERPLKLFLPLGTVERLLG